MIGCPKTICPLSVLLCKLWGNDSIEEPGTGGVWESVTRAGPRQTLSLPHPLQPHSSAYWEEIWGSTAPGKSPDYVMC